MPLRDALLRALPPLRPSDGDACIAGGRWAPLRWRNVRFRRRSSSAPTCRGLSTARCAPSAPCASATQPCGAANTLSASARRAREQRTRLTDAPRRALGRRCCGRRSRCTAR
eukprot:1016941-Prymnesium_polylepis.1